MVYIEALHSLKFPSGQFRQLFKITTSLSASIHTPSTPLYSSLIPFISISYDYGLAIYMIFATTDPAWVFLHQLNRYFLSDSRSRLAIYFRKPKHSFIPSSSSVTENFSSSIGVSSSQIPSHPRRLL